MSDELRRIGFNKHLKQGDAKLMVQTEVLGRERLMIRTTVYRNGVVQTTETQPCDHEGKDIAEVEAAVQAQHDRIVASVVAS